MPTIIIDDREYQVAAETNVLQALLSQGVDLPYFCWHPAMGSIGACRQCAVIQYQNEEDTRGKLVMACMTPVSDGARFSLAAADAFRRNIIEALMINHPHDCPVCAEGGECHLQDMTVMTGHRDRRYRGDKRTFRNQYLGPLLHHEMNRCITCYRCVRFYNDYAGGADLAAQACHNHIYFGRHQDGVLENEFSGNLVEVCPTGVFTDKTLVKSDTRKWDLQSAPSLCVNCGVGCNTLPGERYGKLKRIHNHFHPDVNGYFLCDRGRYGGAFVNSDKRLRYPGQRQPDGRYRAIHRQQALDEIASNWGRAAAIGSPRASIEGNFLLQKLVGPENFNPGCSDNEMLLLNAIREALQQSHSPSLAEVEQADAVLILGEDITNTAPRLALSLRQAVRNKAFDLGAELGLQPWQDAAVRNLAQAQRSPLFIAAVNQTKLADIALHSICLAPDDCTRLGLAVAQRLNAPSDDIDLPEPLTELTGQIVEALSNAKKPLIVSGTGCQHLALIQAAAQIARSLGEHARLCYCVPECNSLGVALFNGQFLSLSEMTERAANGEIDTLLVLENDLYRRAPAATVDRLVTNVKRLVAIDALASKTLSRNDISCDVMALPAATFFESEGTLVNNEGRAQRFYPVIPPSDEQWASWRWLAALGRQLGQWNRYWHFDEVTKACAAEQPRLSAIVDAAPAADVREQGLKIPRQPHRYSGRTAINASKSVHEPQSPADPETPLAYTMEGATSAQLQPFVWQPGWNSNQAVNQNGQKQDCFQNQGKTLGVRLLEAQPSNRPLETLTPPQAFARQDKNWLLVPIYRIFGSEELSVQAPAIAALTGDAFILLHPEDAARLSVGPGDGVTVDNRLSFPLQLDNSLVQGCAGYAAGFPNAAELVAGDRVSLCKAVNWPPNGTLIATDNGGAHD